MSRVESAQLGSRPDVGKSQPEFLVRLESPRQHYLHVICSLSLASNKAEKSANDVNARSLRRTAGGVFSSVGLSLARVKIVVLRTDKLLTAEKLNKI